MNAKLLSCIVSLVVGAGIGCGLRVGAGSEPSPDAHPIAPRSGGFSEHIASAAIDYPQLRAIIRDELATALASNRAGATSSAAVPSAAPTPELMAQRREAVDDIAAVLASGRWGREERRSFYQELARLEPSQAEQAMQQLMATKGSGGIGPDFGAQAP
jgi:hypothetical protein